MPGISAHHSSLVNASPAEVFKSLSDLSRHPEWCADGVTVEAVSGGDPAVGSEYRSQVRFMGKNITGNLRVTDYEPGAKFGFSCSDSNGEFQHIFTLSAQAASTQMEERVTGRVPLIGWLMFTLFADRMIGRPATRKFHQNLKAAVESASG